MRRTVLAAAAMGSVVALVGFAGAASASATIDLVWIDVSVTDVAGDPVCLHPANRNCARDPRSYDYLFGGTAIDLVPASDHITLGVIITAGSNGSWGAGVSVNYGNLLPTLSVAGFQSLTTTRPLAYLPHHLGTTTNRSPYIVNINAAASPPVGYGIGLPAGQSGVRVTKLRSAPANALTRRQRDLRRDTRQPSGTQNRPEARVPHLQGATPAGIMVFRIRGGSYAGSGWRSK